MSLKRTFVWVFISGFFPLIVFAALDGEWPEYSATKWLILFGGLAVIAVVFSALEARFRAKDPDF